MGSRADLPGAADLRGMSVLGERDDRRRFFVPPAGPKPRGARRAVLERVGMGRLAEVPARSLGTPGRKRLEIARALATEPKVLLLDEAMAGLTQREVQLAIDFCATSSFGHYARHCRATSWKSSCRWRPAWCFFIQGREIAQGSPARGYRQPGRHRSLFGQARRQRPPRPTRRSS